MAAVFLPSLFVFLVANQAYRVLRLCHAPTRQGLEAS